MPNWIKSHIDKEDRFGFAVSGGIHLLLLIIALLYQIHFDRDHRAAFVEVTIGEYQTGTIAQQAEVIREQVATRPDPPPVEPEEPEPEVEEPVEIPEEVTEETARDVDLVDQQEEVENEEVINTPVTEEIDPQVTQQQEQQEEVIAPPLTRQDEQIQEGEENSGDVEGTEGEVNADQGTGQDDERAAPFNLVWEGGLQRSPTVQPLPQNVAGEEAVISVRFEVQPNGSIGRILPLIKMNPELESEVMRTLRSWRFSRLPSGVPQEPQWGTITFRFIFE